MRKRPLSSTTSRQIWRPRRPHGLGAVSAVIGLVSLSLLAASLFTTLTGASSASSAGATSGLSGVSSVAGLSGSGSVVPSSSYGVPSGAVFMSPSGSDANSGSVSAPVKSLARAYALVPKSGTVVLRAGTYHDGDLYATKLGVTFQAYPGEQVWLDGSDVVSGWTSDGAGHWYVSWSTPDFCENTSYPSGGYYSQVWPWLGSPGSAGPCVHPDMVLDPSNPAAADPQMVFEDGSNVTEVTSLGAASGSKFFYDFSARRVYLGFNPAGHSVEVTKRPDAMTVNNTTGGIRLLGLGFERYASNEKNEGSTTHGALNVMGTPNVTIANDVFSQNAGTGLNLMGGPKNLVINHDVFAFNGFNGVDANGTESDDNLTIENSVFNNNNSQFFGLNCVASCSAAGSKLAHMDVFLVKDNIFENQQGVSSGFWCDLHCSNGTIVGNVFANNGNIGLFYEVSNTGIIASNLVYGNGLYLESRRPNGTGRDNSDKGAGIRVSAANTQIYNNTSVNNVSDLVVYDDERSPGANCSGCGVTDVGPDTTNVSVANNILSGLDQVAGMDSWLAGSIRRNFNSTPGTGPDSFYSLLDYDSYYRPAGSPAKLEWWDNNASTSNSPNTTTNTFASVADLAAGESWELHGQDITSGTDPFFTAASAGNYCVRPDSVAYNTGKPLPAAVAAAIGVPAGQPVNRGATTWLGQTCTTTTPNQVPVASFTSSCSGLVCSFNANGSTDSDGTVTSSAWTFGDGTTATGMTATHTYSAAGSDTVTLAVTDNKDATDSTSHSVTVTMPNQPPVAAFTASCANLVCSFDASASSDPDGTVAGYAWTFGDGSSATGMQPTHTYAAAGSETVGLVVTDNQNATGSISQSVTASAQDQPPVAAFTSSCTNLVCTFDGSSSYDPDGTVTAYSWDFGDGTTASGVGASHSFAAAGAHTVTLGVTDNQGLTSTTEGAVNPRAAAPVATSPLYASDSFNRVAANGLGTADLGGTWSAAGDPANLSVANGSAAFLMPVRATQISGYLSKVSTTNAETDVTLTSSAAGTSYATYAYVLGRRLSNTSQYRAGLRLVSGQPVVISVGDLSGSSTAVTLQSLTLSSVRYAPGMQLNVRFQVSGTSPTTLQLKVWPSTSPEPAAWQITTTDSTALLQAAGSVGLTTYLSGSANGGAITIYATNFAARPIS